jgi:hypothetical protein
VPPKCRFLQEPHGVTTQKTAFFRFNLYCVLAVTTAVLTTIILGFIQVKFIKLVIVRQFARKARFPVVRP